MVANNSLVHGLVLFGGGSSPNFPLTSTNQVRQHFFQPICLPVQQHVMAEDKNAVLSSVSLHIPGQTSFAMSTASIPIHVPSGATSFQLPKHFFDPSHSTNIQRLLSQNHDEYLRYDQLLKEHEQLQEAHNMLKRKYYQLEDEQEVSTRKIRVLEETKQEYSGVIQELRKIIEELEKENAMLKTENNRLLEALDKRDAEIESFRQEFKKYKTESSEELKKYQTESLERIAKLESEKAWLIQRMVGEQLWDKCIRFIVLGNDRKKPSKTKKRRLRELSNLDWTVLATQLKVGEGSRKAQLDAIFQKKGIASDVEQFFKSLKPQIAINTAHPHSIDPLIALEELEKFKLTEGVVAYKIAEDIAALLGDPKLFFDLRKTFSYYN